VLFTEPVEQNFSSAQLLPLGLLLSGRRTSAARIDIVRKIFLRRDCAPQLTPWIFTFILVGMSRSSKRRQPDRTRARLVEVGFEEIYRRGFQPAGLDTIVERAGVTKGALYHHFPSKLELGYAVLDEVIGDFTDKRWLKPIAGDEDPIDAIVASVREAAKSDFEFGCPLNNLAQEMSTVDAEFHRRIAALYRRWESGVAGALERGQEQGLVRKDVDVNEAATFVVASIEGAYGLAKNRKDRQPLRACVEGLTQYLDALRTPASRRRSEL